MIHRGSVSLALCLVLVVGRSLRADDQADMKKLLAKAIEAAGGEKKLAKYQAATLKMKGTAHLGVAIPFTTEWALQYPNQHKMTVEAKVGDDTYTQVVIINKDKGWIKENTADAKPLDKDTLAEKKEQLYVLSIMALVPLKDKSFKLAPVGELKIGDHDAVGMKISRKGHRDVNLYFDKKTHRLVKSEASVKDMDNKEVTEETTFSEFKKTDGVLYPSKMKIKRDGKKFADVEVTEYKLEEKLDDSEFAKP